MSLRPLKSPTPYHTHSNPSPLPRPLQVYQSTVPKMSLVRHKGVCVFPDTAPEHLAAFVFDHERRREWDTTCLGLKVLYIADHSTTQTDGTLKRYMRRVDWWRCSAVLLVRFDDNSFHPKL